MSGRITHVFVKEGRGVPMRGVPEVTAVTGKGLEGDLAFGRQRRQVLLVGQSSLDDFDLQPGMMRENLTVRGLVLDELAEGTRLEVGEAILEITGDCEPCEQMEALRPGLRKAIDGRRGKLARVARGGTIRPGDAVRATETRSGP